MILHEINIQWKDPDDEGSKDFQSKIRLDDFEKVDSDINLDNKAIRIEFKSAVRELEEKRINGRLQEKGKEHINIFLYRFSIILI